MKRLKLINLAVYSLAIILFFISANSLLALEDEAKKINKKVRSYCVINQGLIQQLKQLLKERMDLLVEWTIATDNKIVRLEAEYKRIKEERKTLFLPEDKKDIDKHDVKLKGLYARIIDLKIELRKRLEEYFQIEQKYEKISVDEYTLFIIKSLAQVNYLTEKRPGFYSEMLIILKKKSDKLHEDVYFNQIILQAKENTEKEADLFN